MAPRTRGSVGLCGLLLGAGMALAAPLWAEDGGAEASYRGAIELLKQGKLAEADAACARSVALAEAAVGAQDPRLLPPLLLCAEISRKAKRWDDATRHLERALALSDRAPQQPMGARTRYLRMTVQLAQHRYDDAWHSGRAALQRADAEGDELLAAQVLARLAEVVAKRGTEPAQALAYLERLMTWLDRQQNPELAALRDGARLILARLLVVLGRLDQAEALIDHVERSVAAQPGAPLRAAADPARADLQADLADTRAALLLARGDSAAALEHADRAEKVLLPWPQLRERRATVLLTLASIYSVRHSPEVSAKHAKAALALCDGPGQLRDRVRALQLAARAYAVLGQPQLALQAQSQALDLLRAQRGAGHPSVLQAEIGLAQVLLATGQGERAAAEVAQTLTRLAGVAGEPDLTTAAALSVLAAALELRPGGEAEALATTDRAIALLRRVAGEDNSDLTGEHSRRSRLLWRVGRHADAVAAAREADRLRELVLGAALGAGSERERRQLVAALQPATDWAVHLALHATAAQAEAATLAAEDVLRRRGRQVDAMAGTLRGLRASLTPETAQLLDQLDVARRTLAAAIQAEQQPGERERFERLRSAQAQVTALEDRASRAMLALRGELRPVSVAQVQAAIGPKALLVEWWVHQPPQGGAERLVALLLSPDQPPRWRDLGELGPLQALSRDWRASLRNPAAADVHTRGEALAQALLAPLRAELDAAETLLVVPDGPLHQLPLAALPMGRDAGERRQFAVQRWQIVWLSSGRDLLRWAAPATPRHPGLVLADPAFGPPANGATWGQLPGARAEGAAVAKLLGKKAELVVGEAANRAALAARPAPRVLHLATHGWFDVVNAATRNALAGVGLALAGANQGSEGRLTGLELASLDLHGTELVTLSACESGLGVSLKGDGVYGMQRALLLAGARSVVMSLWKVDDAATAKLMVHLYGELRRGTPRGEALRRAQLALLAARPAHGAKAATAGARGAEAVGSDPAAAEAAPADHPYTWGAFVLSGERAALGASR